MGAYPNRYNGHEGRQQSQGVDTRSDVTSRAGSLVDAVASSQSAHAIEPITMVLSAKGSKAAILLSGSRRRASGNRYWVNFESASST